MKYFNNITNFEQAKQQYRTLAKQIHPDKGGLHNDFQEMQQEYHSLLLKLKQKSTNININNTQEKADILNELRELGKNLLKSQIPQQFLKKKIQNSQNPYEQLVYKEINKLFDRLL